MYSICTMVYSICITYATENLNLLRLLMELSSKLLNGDSYYILPVKLLIRITL